MTQRETELMRRAWTRLRDYGAKDDPDFENWSLWCLIDELEEALTGKTPITLL